MIPLFLSNKTHRINIQQQYMGGLLAWNTCFKYALFSPALDKHCVAGSSDCVSKLRVHRWLSASGMEEASQEKLWTMQFKLREKKQKQQHLSTRAVALWSPNCPWHTRKIPFLHNMTLHLPSPLGGSWSVTKTNWGKAVWYSVYCLNS